MIHLLYLIVIQVDKFYSDYLRIKKRSIYRRLSSYLMRDFQRKYAERNCMCWKNNYNIKTR